MLFKFSREVCRPIEWLRLRCEACVFIERWRKNSVN